jgi:hypothetical protein
LRKVTASMRVIFIGSAAFAAACIGEGRAVIPAAASEPAPSCLRNDLRLVILVCTISSFLRQKASLSGSAPPRIIYPGIRACSRAVRRADRERLEARQGIVPATGTPNWLE